MQNKGKEFHKQAATAREMGNLTESLYRVDDALLGYDEASDDAGFAEGLGCRSITLRLLAEQRNDSKRILLLAKHEMMAAIEIVRASGKADALAIPTFELGKVYQYMGDLSAANQTFKDALTSFQQNPPAGHNKPSVVADMQIHEGITRYQTGDIRGLTDAESALLQLEQLTDGNIFEKNVWLSGGHMHIAEMLQEKNPSIGKEHFLAAKKIIESNPELVIRKQQLERLAKIYES